MLQNIDGTFPVDKIDFAFLRAEKQHSFIVLTAVSFMVCSGGHKSHRWLQIHAKKVVSF
jgi:hypothetical protein